MADDERIEGGQIALLSRRDQAVIVIRAIPLTVNDRMTAKLRLGRDVIRVGAASQAKHTWNPAPLGGEPTID
jgi:hypothetical protein